MVQVPFRLSNVDIVFKRLWPVAFPYLVVQGEEEIMFIDYRKQLKVLFDNIAQLVRLLVLEFGLGLIVLALEWSV